jgi:DNA-binding Lrp family transcriptional regulator
MEAYILIEVVPGAVRDVLHGIKEVQGVECVKACTGVYDIIAFVKAPDVKTLGDIVVSKIQAIKGVSRTNTSICVDL